MTFEAVRDGLIYGACGYVVVSVASYLAVLQFSSNVHDRSVEAAMTSVFFYGPVGAILAFVAGWIRGRRPVAAKPDSDRGENPG